MRAAFLLFVLGTTACGSLLLLDDDPATPPPSVIDAGSEASSDASTNAGAVDAHADDGGDGDASLLGCQPFDDRFEASTIDPAWHIEGPSTTSTEHLEGSFSLELGGAVLTRSIGGCGRLSFAMKVTATYSPGTVLGRIAFADGEAVEIRAGQLGLGVGTPGANVTGAPLAFQAWGTVTATDHADGTIVSLVGTSVVVQSQRILSIELGFMAAPAASVFVDDFHVSP